MLPAEASPHLQPEKGRAAVPGKRGLVSESGGGQQKPTPPRGAFPQQKEECGEERRSRQSP